jgi:hypothetical protein
MHCDGGSHRNDNFIEFNDIEIKTWLDGIDE